MASSSESPVSILASVTAHMDFHVSSAAERAEIIRSLKAISLTKQ